MKRLLILIVCLSLITSTGMSANKKKKIVKAKKVEIVEDPKFTAMLSSTAKITIFDSIVVDSLKFIDVIHVNQEEGFLTYYQDFFREKGEGMVYINELGNKCIYSKFDEEKGGKFLFQSDLLPDGWTTGEPLRGIDDNGRLRDFDFPYLMPDGVTLYFSAKGKDGLGGYDIYRTRLNIEDGKYLKPENIGLPFNSDADDYGYVIDEQNQMAFFTSNRRQPQGKTCVYYFIPTETRKIINNADEKKIRSFARIDRIADTWSNKREIAEAKQRYATLMSDNATNANHNNMTNSKYMFVINDNTTYYSLIDFKNPENVQRMKTLLSLKQQAETLSAALQKSRNYYATATMSERTQLKQEILQSEQQLEEIHSVIHSLEKTIRITENQ